MAHSAKFVSINGSSSNNKYGRNNNGPVPASGGNQGRFGRHGSSYGGGGGGMVVLSRPKPANKLSVPPPLNLPSLRKEHERFDPSGPGSVPGRTGLGPGPGSHAVGWTKPAVFKDPLMNNTGTGSQIGGPVVPASQSQSFVDKAVILKGEDFPTLCAATHTLPSKQSGSNRVDKKKALAGESSDRRPASPMLMDMRPQMRPQRGDTGNSFDKGETGDLEKQMKLDESLPLPIVRVQYKSDWADDERDTGLSLPERDRTGFMKHEPSQNRDFYDSTGRVGDSGGYRDSFGKDSVFSNKDSRDNSWRSPLQNHRNSDTNRPYSAERGNNTHTQSNYNNNGNKNSWYARNNHNNVSESNSNNWYRGNSNSFQNNSGTKVYSSPLSNNKGFNASDNVSSFMREKRTILSPAKPTYIEDLSYDPIGEVNLTVLKKRKEIRKEQEFPDPVRESFEAELDNILRMQEMERQKVHDERTRVIEMARREEEERERLVREERERATREEEEARRVVWQAEQEKVESAKRAEELRIAREEEKKRMFLEEERRKEAARKKLLEIEARIARRQSESITTGQNSIDRDEGERQVDRVNTASPDSSTMNRYFDIGTGTGTGSRLGTVRDGIGNGINSSFVDHREGHSYYGPRDPFQDQEHQYHGPGAVRRVVFNRKDQIAPDGVRTQRWENNSGFNRNHQSELDSEFLDGDRFGDAGWVSSNISPRSQYDMNGTFSFNRPSRYGSRQPRVLPPPAVTSIHRGSVTDDLGATSSYRDPYLESPQQNVNQGRVEEGGNLVEETEEKAFDSQSSVSVTSPPLSPPNNSHDEIDLPAPPTSAETPQSYNENADMDAASDEWVPEGDDNGTVHRVGEYEEEEETKDMNEVGEVFGDVSGDTEQIILGFDEGVQVPIPRDGSSEYEIEKTRELKTEPANDVLEEKISETEKEFNNLSLDQQINPPLVASQGQVASTTGFPAPIAYPMNPIMPLVPNQLVPTQTEMPINLQFGLFSGPSLIPTPIPAIQIGSIQMPIHLHSHLNPAITQIQPPRGPLFQFGQLRYAPQVVPQEIPPIPSFIQPDVPVNPYISNPNSVPTVLPLQTNDEPSRNSSQEKVINPLQLNVLENKQNKEVEKSSQGVLQRPSANKEPQVQVQFSASESRARVSETRVSNRVPSTGTRGRTYGNYYNNNNNNNNREIGTRFVQTGTEISRRDSRGGYPNRRPRRGVRREFRVRENNERRENPEKKENQLAEQEKSYERSETNVTGTQMRSTVNNPRLYGVSENLVQSGVVRVFEQHGIEVPNDEHGFIEVRSKKQMLNDRREKREREREREIKPKPRMQKVSRKHHQDVVVRSNSSRNRGTVESTGRILSKVLEPSGSKSLLPIGTKPLENDTTKSVQPSKTGSTLLFEGTTSEKAPSNLGSWDSAQQVMPLTQSQLDDAMSPTQFESRELTKPIIPVQEKPSPINSLLAGEKIQFGAVTSPTILPSVSRSATSSGLGAPGSSRPSPLPKTEPPIETRFEEQIANLEEVDEAEAAASAVAVAAISNDDVGSADVSIISEHKSVPTSNLTVLTTGGTSTSNETPNQSTATTEECSSLTVALPADLSVDTQSLTMWPQMASPQSSTPILSQFPPQVPQQPSHFSCFEMNPAMLGGTHHPHHILSFPHDESSSQNHRGVPAWAGPHPSGVVDSFYRPGFGGPFMGPGGMQAPPHMLVYNHFGVAAPVGQFGQVGQYGLSFVGSAPPPYVPSSSDNQVTEWKQNLGQGDMNRRNVGPGPGPGHSQGMAGPTMGLGPMQHMRPTSGLLPMPMFDMNPFQPSGEMPMQPCWPHMPPGRPQFNSLPVSVPPLQQHLGQNPNMNPSSNHVSFHEPSALSDKNRVVQYHDELGPVERPVLPTGITSHSVPPKVEGDNSTGTRPMARATSSMVGERSEMAKSQHGNGTMVDRRGKNEWQRRGGYHHARKQGSGQDKGFGTGGASIGSGSTGRIKQIYVAKSNGTSSTLASSGTSNV